MDVQASDYENAAYSVFVVLLSRVILSFNLNLYIPISKVDENIQRAQKRNAVLKQLFYFRNNIAENDKRSRNSVSGSHSLLNGREYKEMTVNEIINGSSDFPGLVPLIEKYLNYLKVDYNVRCKLSNYLSLISKRASGELPTLAAYLRRFVRRHKDYKFDSVINETISYDLIKEVISISNGDDKPELFGNLRKVHVC